jgi:hypothetical protein
MVSIAGSVNDEMNRSGPSLMRYYLDNWRDLTSAMPTCPVNDHAVVNNDTYQEDFLCTGTHTQTAQLV